MAVVERAGGEQRQREEAGQWSAEAASNAPDHGEAHNADDAAAQSARFPEVERQYLRGVSGQHVEAAAIGVEIDEMECALIGKA